MKEDLVNYEHPKYLRALVMAMVAAGALGSLFKTFQAGQNNNAHLLVSLFLIWVLSPFTALFAANLFSKKWPLRTQMMLYILSAFICIGSLIAYSGMWTVPGAKKAFVFLVTPSLSWLIMIVALIIIKFKRTT